VSSWFKLSTKQSLVVFVTTSSPAIRPVSNASKTTTAIASIKALLTIGHASAFGCGLPASAYKDEQTQKEQCGAAQRVNNPNNKLRPIKSRATLTERSIQGVRPVLISQ
jgi:hypothetical protein